MNNNLIGLLIALSLGLVAGVLNWKYLDRKSQQIEMVSFTAIAENVRLRPGDTFQESHFVPVDIPRRQVGNLPESAVLYADRHTIVSIKALHAYDGGELLLRQDLKTPPSEFTLLDNERAMWIPVDVGTFVPALISPGDQVSFIVSSPLPGDVAQVATSSASQESINELVGPFRVISLGGRLGSYEVFQAAGESTSRENVMGIAVKVENDELDPKARKLFGHLRKTNVRQVGVLLHPRNSSRVTRLAGG